MYKYLVTCTFDLDIFLETKDIYYSTYQFDILDEGDHIEDQPLTVKKNEFDCRNMFDITLVTNNKEFGKCFYYRAKLSNSQILIFSNNLDMKEILNQTQNILKKEHIRKLNMINKILLDINQKC